MTDSAGSIKGMMHTRSGRLVSPLAMTPDQLDVRDIAYGLAGIFRYGGQSRITVAEHCVHVSVAAQREADACDADDIVSVHVARWGLLHDGSEYGLGDQIRPLKMTPEYVFFGPHHHRLTAVLGEWLGIGLFPDDLGGDLILDIDTHIVANEALTFPRRDPRWILPEPWPGIVVETWSPEVAERRWLERFNELWPDRAVTL